MGIGIFYNITFGRSYPNLLTFWSLSRIEKVLKTLCFQDFLLQFLPFLGSQLSSIVGAGAAPGQWGVYPAS